MTCPSFCHFYVFHAVHYRPRASPAFGQAITYLFLRCNTHLVAAITLIMVVKAPLLLPPTLVQLSTHSIKLSGKVILKGGGLILLGRQSRKGMVEEKTR